MGTIYGESSITSYASNGGIALYSTENLDPGTITGGSGDSEDGTAGSITRIKWTISYDGDAFSGGITGVSWFRTTDTIYMNGLDSPFEGHTDEEIYREASTSGNLDSFFNAWNSMHSAPNDTTILEFQLYLQTNYSGCITVGGVG